MTSLWFVVPVHGRLQLTAICLKQLKRTCEHLRVHGIDASAVIVGDNDTLADLQWLLEGTLGFWAVERNNQFLSRKFNDGFQFACERGKAHYVVPFGSDDWADHQLFLDLPPRDTVYGFQHMSFVREDGRELVTKLITYPGGCGIRIYPAPLLRALDYRPADEDRPRGCDTSILNNVQKWNQSARIVHVGLDPRQIVDWKSSGQQLNRYDDLRRHRSSGTADPFEALAGMYPAEALEEMAAHYGVMVPA